LPVLPSPWLLYLVLILFFAFLVLLNLLPPSLLHPTPIPFTLLATEVARPELTDGTTVPPAHLPPEWRCSR
jgi:hypothetical protein